jgi:hypothetical protein
VLSNVREQQGQADMTAQGVRGVTFALAAALLTAASSASIAAAQAQQVVQGQFTFDIKAKPVPQAVNDIGRIAGLSVVFRENRPWLQFQQPDDCTSLRGGSRKRCAFIG